LLGLWTKIYRRIENDIWKEFVAEGFLDPEELWEKGIAACQVHPHAKVSRNEIMQIMHDALFRHVYHPPFLVKQVAQTLKSAYRMNVFVNNLSRLAEIREGANSIA
jgi:hypothetical protein